MGSKRGKTKRFRRVRLVIVLAAIYVGGSIGYYFLPWSVRKAVYKTAPALDRTLRRNGFKMIEGWDGLGLWGRDCSVAADRFAGGLQVYGGWPAQGVEQSSPVTILKNQSYTVGYSEAMKNPLWVAYRVFDVPYLESGKRPSHFRIDSRTEAKVSHDDYTRSGYDRGHMAPNYAIATRYGSDGQRETFLMSNVIPQVPQVNRYFWRDLEWRVARRYGRYFGEVWVLTGPVFTEPVGQLDSGVSIPSGYYKIIADEEGDELRVLAFLVESGLPPYARLKSRLVSVDQLEERTGLDFFPDLSEHKQAQLESKPAGRLWPWVMPAIRHSFNP